MYAVARFIVMRLRPATLAALLASLWWLGGATQARARTFADRLSTPIEQLFARSLARTIGRSLPVTAASAGVSYTFDPETGAFTRETSILGQLFLERAAPVGRGKLNVNVNYQHVQLDTVDGEPLGHLNDTTSPIIDPSTGRPFNIPRFGIKLDTHEATASATASPNFSCVTRCQMLLIVSTGSSPASRRWR